MLIITQERNACWILSAQNRWTNGPPFLHDLPDRWHKVQCTEPGNDEAELEKSCSEIKAPVTVPSISSFRTQISPPNLSIPNTENLPEAENLGAEQETLQAQMDSSKKCMSINFAMVLLIRQFNLQLAFKSYLALLQPKHKWQKEKPDPYWFLTSESPLASRKIDKPPIKHIRTVEATVTRPRSDL